MHVVYALCAHTRQIMKLKSMEFVARKEVKSKPTLLWYFARSKNVGNAEPLRPVCDSLPLPFDGNGLSKFSYSNLNGLRFLTLSNVALPFPIVIDVISPLPSPTILELAL